MKKNIITLTEDNYYDINEYMSSSLMKIYFECFDKGNAVRNKKWEYGTNDAMLLGTAFHTYWEDRDKFYEILSKPPYTNKSGSIYSKFKVVDKMIKTVESDNLCQQFLDGEHEKIYTGVIEGLPFKCKIDIENDGFIADIKTMRDIPQDDFGYVKFYNQLSIYRELVRQNTNIKKQCYIIAVSTEQIPNKEVTLLHGDALDYHWTLLKDQIKHLKDMGINDIPLSQRCEHCDYCRSTKQLDFPRVINCMA